jgi:hypothetical protein
MTLTQRYRKLTLLNKLAVWGSVCSIVSVALFFLPPISKPKDPPATSDQIITVNTLINSPTTVQSPRVPVVGSNNVVTINYNNGTPIAEQQTFRNTTEIERYTKGGAYPQISVEPYFGPSEGLARTLSTTPEKPGFLAVLIENTNDFPIFDLEIYMLDLTPQDRDPRTMETFNDQTTAKVRSMQILHPNKIMTVLLPANPNCRKLAFDFNSKTRAADTSHKFRFAIISNRWESARTISDVKTGKIIASDTSPNFPQAAAWNMK